MNQSICNRRKDRRQVINSLRHLISRLCVSLVFSYCVLVLSSSSSTTTTTSYIGLVHSLVPKNLQVKRMRTTTCNSSETKSTTTYIPTRHPWTSLYEISSRKSTMTKSSTELNNSHDDTNEHIEKTTTQNNDVADDENMNNKNMNEENLLTSVNVVPTTTKVTSINTSTGSDTPLGSFLRGLVRTSMKETIAVNSIVVARVDIPSLGIWTDQTYEVKTIYLQGEMKKNSNTVERVPLDEVLLPSSSSTGNVVIPNGFTQYIELYNPNYHNENTIHRGMSVKVTPEEVGLVSLRTEVFDSILFALPVLGFWTTTCWIFTKIYTDRYGGNFFDALFGR